MHYACGCVSDHRRIWERHLAMYAQACRRHGDGQFQGAGWRLRVDKVREISFDEEMAMLWAEAFAMGSLYDAQMEDQNVVRGL